MGEKINSNKNPVKRGLEIVGVILGIMLGIILNYALYQYLKLYLDKIGQFLFVIILISEILFAAKTIIKRHADYEKSTLGHLPQSD